MQELIKGLRGELIDCNCYAYSAPECGCGCTWPSDVAGEAADLIESQAAEIEKYKALCNQMGNALQMMRGFYPAYCDEALKAWRAMK